jgi:hypothetical protein
MPLINFFGGPFATRLKELLLCHAQWLVSTTAATYPIRHCYFFPLSPTMMMMMMSE